MQRRVVTFFGILCMLWALGAAASQLTPARDLEADGRLSREQRVPILLFFTSDYCPYCEHVRDLYLEPMLARGDYAGRLLVREVRIEGSTRLRDFAGRDTDHERFAQVERATFTPTVRLYDGQGKEVVPALRGFSSPDFYGWLLEGAIQAAIDKLRPHAAAAASP